MMTEVKEDSWASSQEKEKEISIHKDDVEKKEKEKSNVLSKEEVIKSKRLFGMIKGTLNSLKEKSAGEIKREKVQEKLLVKLAAEKKEMQEKLSAEVQAKKDRVLQARKDDDFNRISSMVAFLDENHQKLLEFNLTETEPRIYFKPKKHSIKSRENLEKSRQNLKSHNFNIKEYMEKEYPSNDNQEDQVLQDVQIDSDQIVESMQDV